MTIRRFIRIQMLFVLAILVASTDAHAQTLGNVISSVTASFGNFPNIISVFAYMGGLFFAVVGLFKFKDHVDHPHQTPLSAGVKRFLAGGMLLAAPYMTSVLRGTFFGAGGTVISATNRHTAAAVNGGGMDQMIYDFIADVAGPTEKLLIGFTYIAGLILLLTGIHRLTKTYQEGPRGPAGMGTIMTLLAAGALFSFGDMMGSFSTSLFGTAQITTYAKISPTVISNAADADRIATVIEALMTFIMLVGYIAFIRGWFVLKSFADGNGSVSLTQAFTFLFGGALAINLGPLVNVLQTTLGINGISFN